MLHPARAADAADAEDVDTRSVPGELSGWEEVPAAAVDSAVADSEDSAAVEVSGPVVAEPAGDGEDVRKWFFVNC